MRLIFVSNNWADAHHQVRLNALRRLYPSLVCVAFTRTYYPSASVVEPIWRGKMEHASYLKRWNIYFQFFKQLFKIARDHDIIYVYGFDLAVISLILKFIGRRSVTLVYEVPDIREIFFRKGIAGRILRGIEKLVIPRVDLLIVTSGEYVTEYYQKIRRLQIVEYLVIENKLHKSVRHVGFPPRQQPIRKVRIGYFGLLRCPASLDCLLLLARSNEFEIILRGIFMPLTRHYENLVKEEANIAYSGPYDATKELDSLYNSVDVVWAAYPYAPQSEPGNHLWARTNRFYECLYFQKPMILQKDTSDAKRSRMLGPISIEIDLKNPVQAADTLRKQLTSSYLKIFENAFSVVPEKEYMIKDEYQRLAQCLQLRK